MSPPGFAATSLADLEGKGRRIRTVAIPICVKQGIKAWMIAGMLEQEEAANPVCLVLAGAARLVADSISEPESGCF